MIHKGPTCTSGSDLSCCVPTVYTARGPTRRPRATSTPPSCSCRPRAGRRRNFEIRSRTFELEPASGRTCKGRTQWAPGCRKINPWSNLRQIIWICHKYDGFTAVLMLEHTLFRESATFGSSRAVAICKSISAKSPVWSTSFHAFEARLPFVMPAMDQGIFS